MGGRWSLVQIQSPRPFLCSAPGQPRPMLACLGYLTADLAVRVLPVGPADRLARGLARLAFALRPPARRRLEANLAQWRPGMSAAARRATAREAFEHFALSLADSLRLARLAPAALERAIEVRGREHLEHARTSGRGVILLSAHAGNWEWGAAWLASHGPPLHVVARPHPDRRVDRRFHRLRRARGVGMLPGRLLWTGASPARRAVPGPKLMRVAVLIPAYQAGAQLQDVLARVAALAECSQVLVVDDGSTDDTAAVARAAGVRVLALPVNRGKGHALVTGFAALPDCDAVVTLDADGQHPPECVPDFVRAAEAGADLALGVRVRSAAMPPLRRFANRFSSGWATWLAGQCVAAR